MGDDLMLVVCGAALGAGVTLLAVLLVQDWIEWRQDPRRREEKKGLRGRGLHR